MTEEMKKKAWGNRKYKKMDEKVGDTRLDKGKGKIHMQGKEEKGNNQMLL